VSFLVVTHRERPGFGGLVRFVQPESPIWPLGDMGQEDGMTGTSESLKMPGGSEEERGTPEPLKGRNVRIYIYLTGKSLAGEDQFHPTKKPCQISIDAGIKVVPKVGISAGSNIAPKI
jgi:hypothetical protein